ncbi:TolC family protein [Bacteroidales bacterium OttesenSCG-928-M11]|nr:TolC family protein [Bacteroidales bacterium OttesenSCG-928-M11]
MKNIVIILIFLSIAFSLQAQQTIGNVLLQIEENNTVLTAMKKETEAEKIGNKTGIYLENPEVEYEYLWGVDNSDESVQKFSVTQSFDFPTSYYYKKKLSDNQNEQVDLEFRIKRKEILLEAKKLCIELVYQQNLSKELKEQFELMESIQEKYLKKFDNGDLNIIELNKSKFELINKQREYEYALAELNFLRTELIRLNGGKDLDLSNLESDVLSFPASFEEWYALAKSQNISLLHLQQETSLIQKTEKLQRSMNLPKLSAGYSSEKGVVDHFRGVVVGMSIPLFENKNTVKQLKAQKQASLASEINEELRFYNESKALYDKANALNKALDSYTISSPDYKVLDHLYNAMEFGEISAIEFFLELNMYYDIMLNMHEIKRDRNLVIAELTQWEL